MEIWMDPTLQLEIILINPGGVDVKPSFVFSFFHLVNKYHPEVAPFLYKCKEIKLLLYPYYSPFPTEAAYLKGSALWKVLSQLKAC